MCRPRDESAESWAPRYAKVVSVFLEKRLFLQKVQMLNVEPQSGDDVDLFASGDI